MKAYRIANTEEKDERGVSEEYDLLIGPNGFECFLGEPEDRSWDRDAPRRTHYFRLYLSNQGGVHRPPHSPPPAEWRGKSGGAWRRGEGWCLQRRGGAYF
jgi:hypothetical protein